MLFHDLIFILLAFASEILGTLSGFGSSTFFVPLAIHLEKIQFVLALTAILHCFGNTSKIYLFREHFHWRSFVELAVPSLVFAGVGALLTEHLPVEVLRKGLGVTLILTSGVFLLGKFKFQRFPTWVAVALCGLSGFMTGLVGTGGAIRGIALSSLKLQQGAFVSLSAGIDFGGDLLRMLIYFKNGFMDWSQWFYIPALAAAAFAGVRVGKAVLSKVNHDQFERLVALFVFIGGVALLIPGV